LRMASHSSHAPWDEDANAGERAAAAALAAAPWEAASGDGDGDGDGGDAGDEGAELPAPSPAEALVAHWIHLYIARKISAMDCCISMFHAAQFGMAEAAPYARKPGLDSNRYSEHLKEALGYRSDSQVLYEIVDNPCRQAGVMGRSNADLIVIPAHEAFDESAEAEADLLRDRLRSAKAAGNLPRCYSEHPVVQAHPDEDVLPGAIFADGVAYANTDGVLGIWLVCLLTGRRHLLAAVRKRRLCNCGCRGWCSLYGMFVFLSWSLMALADKLHPSTRHDRRPWRALDLARSLRAGKEMTFRFACLYIKADWLELATSFGFPAHNDGIRPCFKCNCHDGNMHDTAAASAIGLPWRENEHGDYEAACVRCELHVRLEAADHALVCFVLTDFDKRQMGALGRALSRDVVVAGVELRKGDRLDPSPSVPDTGAAFDGITTFPLDVVFWRRSRESLTRRRNPLFNRVYGVTAERSLTADVLHAIHLGIMKALVMFVLWFLLDAKLWGEHGTQEESFHVNLQGLSAGLHHWYGARHREYPRERLTRIHELTDKVVGRPHERKLSSKGAETHGLLLFVIFILTNHAARLPDAANDLLEACKALARMLEIFKTCGNNVPGARLQEAFDMMHTLYSRTELLVEGMQVAKRHLMVHLLKDIDYLGNPNFYANWYDESLNKLFKSYLRTVSQATFEPFVLLRMRDGLSHEAARKRKADDERS
jgi:hypothetical protein